MEPRSGQDQQSGIGTNQDPQSAPTHFQKDLGEWTVHDNRFAWEVKVPEQGKLVSKKDDPDDSQCSGAALGPGHPRAGVLLSPPS